MSAPKYCNDPDHCTYSDCPTAFCDRNAEHSLAAPAGCAARWSVKPIFAWYDLWVGIFWDSRKRKLYILPVPCVGVVIEIPKRHNAEVSEVAVVDQAKTRGVRPPLSLD